MPVPTVLERKSLACRFLAVDIGFEGSTYEFDQTGRPEEILVSGNNYFRILNSPTGFVTPESCIKGKDLDNVFRDMLKCVTAIEPQPDLDSALREAAGWHLSRRFPAGIATFLAPKSLVEARFQSKQSTFLWFNERGYKLPDEWFSRRGVYGIPKDKYLGVVNLPLAGLEGDSKCAIAVRHTRCVFVPIGRAGTATEEQAASV